MHFIVTTPVNRQYDAMWEIQWAVKECNIKKTPYRGLLLMEADESAGKKIKEYDTTAIHRVIPLDALVAADLSTITKTIISIAEEKIIPEESFAVRCKRRGFPIPSMDIESKIGSEIVEKFNNPVDLDNPDKVILIEIIKKKAGVAILKRSEIINKEVLEL